jgi:protocatechuate 3,4-dioxygenase beta subunit
MDRFPAKCLAFLIGLVGVVADPAQAAAAPVCAATPADALGPFYRPNAPVRSSVGKGYVLSGTVRSSADCAAIPGARVELWLAGPNGYDDDHRATVIADGAGRYRFESEMPGRYERRPPHIHVRVAHPGHQTLVTQHYPAQGQAEGTFDLVLTPAASRSSR